MAKLYEDISTGPTDVPLRGPPNRWEGPDVSVTCFASTLSAHYYQVPPLLRQIMEAVQAEEARRHQPSQDSRPSPKPKEQSLRTLSSSASKPPPAHPILKKARGPSASGPRPTARFVSPHESDEDEEDEIPSSGSTATGSEVPIYAVSPKKKTPIAPAKKHIAPLSAPTAKMRALKSKRPDAHPNSTSDTPREKRSSVGSNTNGQSLTNLIVERPLEQVTSPSEESVSSFTSLEQPVMSEKARGKQPIKPLRPMGELNGVLKQKPPRRTSVNHEQPTMKRQEMPTLPQAQSLIDLTGHSRRSSGASKSTFGIGSLESASAGGGAPPSMSRSSSHTGYDRSTARPPGMGLITGATTSTSNIAAQGTILDQSGLSALPLPTILGELPSHHFNSIEAPAPSILDSRLVPTQPTTAASVPLGRTKSQLTLLLEREKARIGNKPRSKS